MGALLWLLVAIALLWFAEIAVLPVDSLLFMVVLFLAGVSAIKAIVDGIEALGAIGDAFRERGGDYDDE